MAFTIVQSVSANVNSAASVSKAITSTTAGNLLLVIAVCSNTSVVLTPSASVGTAQTFTSIADKQPGTGQLQAWYVKNCAAGTTTIQVSRASGTGQWALTVMELSGADTSAPLDKEADSTASGTTGTTATTAQATEFWFAMFLGGSASGGAPTFSGLAAAWTQDKSDASTLGGANTDVSVLTAYQMASSTGTANATCTVTGAAGNGVAGIVATFIGSAAATPSVNAWVHPTNQPTASYYKTTVVDY